MPPFDGKGSIESRLQTCLEEKVYFKPPNTQEFPGLIWSILEKWKAHHTAT